jgi:hypothetical protein
MRLLHGIVLLLMPVLLAAQDSTHVRPLTMNGYIKDMQTLNFSGDFNDLITGNLIHNRLNFRYRPHKNFSAGLEMRNRLFWGEEVRLIPDFSSSLPYSSEWVDLLFTNIDRLWVEYSSDTWNVRAGRQRINWGISTTWNPNDLFNTYNFLDFDYEERPACDAVKLHYQFSGMSFAEFAVSRSAEPGNNVIAAGRYFINRWNYDFQLLSGWYRDQPTVGAGWSGSISNAGFKGEMQYFLLHQEVIDQLNVSVEADYIFSSGWYISAGGLYNSRGLDEPIGQWSVTSLELSPRNPMPTKWNLVSSVSKQITPLFTASLGMVYAPKTNFLILLPGLQYNLATNLDINLFWQSFFAEQHTSFEALNHRVFLRFKLSF